MVQFILNAAQNGGELVRPWLGARLQEVTGDIARSIGLPRNRGALVTEIYPNGPADDAGLQSGDVILMLDDRMVEDLKRLTSVCLPSLLAARLICWCCAAGRKWNCNCP